MKKIIITIFLVVLGYPVLSQDKDTLSVVSFNIRYNTMSDGLNAWDYRKAAVLKMFSIQKPDIVGVQEALHDQVLFLDEFLSDYKRVGVGRDDGAKEGEYVAVYYRSDRFLLLDSGNFWLSETPTIPSKGWDAACNRMVTWVQLRENNSGKELFLFNAHFDHVGVIARKESVILLADQIKELTDGSITTVFVTGDFNSPTCDPIFDPLKKLLSSAREAAPVTDDRDTFNGYGTDSEMIDHIFFSYASPLFFKVLTENYGVMYISDHYPVMAKFVF